MEPEHFVLLLDILGFKNLVQEQSLDSICKVIEETLLNECEEWTSSGPHAEFDTIHFSDTVLIHTREPGFHKEWFDDLCFIGARVCSRLLSEEIPVRGSMAYGSFLRRRASRHEVFVGKAIIDAYRSEQTGSFLGFSVASNIWTRLYNTSGAGDALEQMGVGLVLPDGSLWVNPLTEFADRDKNRLLFNLRNALAHPDEGSGYLPTELLAFDFVDATADAALSKNEALGSPETKYVNTQRYFRRAFGADVYEFAKAEAHTASRA